MTKRSEITSGTNNSSATSTSTHETGKYSTPELQSAYDAGRGKKTSQNVCAFKKVRTFAVRQFFISYGMGIFYAQKAAILKNIGKLYPHFIVLMPIRNCRRFGYFLPFLCLTK